MNNLPINPNGNGSHRDAKGKFLPGNPGGPGNPINAKMSFFRAVLMEKTTRADIEAITEKLIECARGGEPWAIREFLDRTMGRAPQCVELTGADGGPVALNTHQLTAVILECLPDAESRLRAASKLKELTTGPTSHPPGGGT